MNSAFTVIPERYIILPSGHRALGMIFVYSLQYSALSSFITSKCLGDLVVRAQD